MTYCSDCGTDWGGEIAYPCCDGQQIAFLERELDEKDDIIANLTEGFNFWKGNYDLAHKVCQEAAKLKVYRHAELNDAIKNWEEHAG